MFPAIVNEVSGKVLKKFEAECQADLVDSLRAFGEQYMETLISEEALMLYRASVSEARYFPELAQTFFENGPEEDFEPRRRTLRLYGREGYCKVREPRATAALFICMIRSDHHIAAVLTGKTISRPAVKRCLAAAVETLMRGA